MRPVDPEAIKAALDLGWPFHKIAEVLQRPEQDIRRIAWVNQYLKRIHGSGLTAAEKNKYQRLRNQMSASDARRVFDAGA